VPARRRPARTRSGPDLIGGDSFIRSIALEREMVKSFDDYPYSLPAIHDLQTLALHPKVTYFIGENGTGKSTLMEAIAVSAGFNPEGGSRNFNFSTRQTHSELHSVLRLVRSARRQHDGYFLRAESFYNVASQVDDLAAEDRDGGSRMHDSYGGRSLHAQSHGESFLALAVNRFGNNGLYLLDEPEAALSPLHQLSLLALIDDHVRHRGSQFLIATHSPILMAYPEALLYEFSAEHGIRQIDYEATEHFQLTRDFLNDRHSFFKNLFED
jgi:predicted ATPase